MSHPPDMGNPLSRTEPNTSFLAAKSYPKKADLPHINRADTTLVWFLREIRGATCEQLLLIVLCCLGRRSRRFASVRPFERK